MSEIQFQMIMKILNNGAPALAEELCNAVAMVVNDNVTMAAELEKLRADTKVNAEQAADTVK